MMCSKCRPSEGMSSWEVNLGPPDQEMEEAATAAARDKAAAADAEEEARAGAAGEVTFFLLTTKLVDQTCSTYVYNISLYLCIVIDISFCKIEWASVTLILYWQKRNYISPQITCKRLNVRSASK